MAVTYFGENSSGDQNDTVSNTYRVASKFSNTAGAGVVTELGIYMGTCYTPFNMKFGIYADDGGSPSKPGALLYDCGVLAITTTGWNTKTGLNYTIADGATVWIGQLADAGGESMRESSAGTNTFMYLGSSSYASFPYDPFGAGTLTTGVVCVRVGVEPAVPVLTQSQFRFFDDGDELPHMDAAVVPVIEAGDITGSGNNTAETSPDVAYPAHSSGDLIIQVLVSDADAAHTNPGSTGPNGETINQICFNQETGGSNGPHLSVVWWIASGNTGGGNQVWTIASEQWTGFTIVVPAGEFYATTPIGTISALGSNDSDAATADTPAFTPNRSGGRVVAVGGVDTDPMDATYAPSGWTGRYTYDRGAVSCFCATRDALSVASEQVAAASFGINPSDSFACIAFVVNGTVSVADGRTPLAAAGTDPTLDVDTAYGVSIRVQNSGGATTEDTYKWQYKRNAGSWTDITNASSVVKASATADFANGADVAEYIGGTGTYTANNNAALDTTGTLTMAAVFGASAAFESHLNFEIVGADVADEDLIYLRIVYEDGTAFDSYGASDTNIPAITVNEAVAGVTLTVDGASIASAADNISLAQQHILAVSAAALASAASSPALVQHSALVVSGAALAVAAASPTLVENRTLAVAGAAIDSAASSPTLVQASQIAVDAAALASAADNIALTQQHTIAVQGAAIASAADSLSLVQASALAVNSAAIASTADGDIELVAGANDTEIAVDGADVALAASTPTLVEQRTLAVQAADVASAASTPTLVELRTLAVDSAALAAAAENVALVENRTLAVQSADVAHAAGSVTLVENRTLATQDAALASVADNIALVQASTLAVDAAAVALESDNVPLSSAETLGVQSAAIASAAETPTLVQQHTLAVQSADVAVAASAPTLVENRTLAIASATLELAAASVDLSSPVMLVVSDAAMPLTAESVLLAQAHILGIDSAVVELISDEARIGLGISLAIQEAAIASAADRISLSAFGVGHPAEVAHIVPQEMTATVDGRWVANPRARDTEVEATSNMTRFPKPPKKVTVNRRRAWK